MANGKLQRQTLIRNYINDNHPTVRFGWHNLATDGVIQSVGKLFMDEFGQRQRFWQLDESGQLERRDLADDDQ